MNEDIATHFLLLHHFCPCLNNVLHQRRTVHIDSRSTTTKFSHDCKNEPPYPCTPAWRHIVVLAPFTTPAPQKSEKKTFTTTSFTCILTQCTVCSTYPNYRPFYIFDTPFIENIHTLCIANSTNSSLMPSTAV